VLRVGATRRCIRSWCSSTHYSGTYYSGTYYSGTYYSGTYYSGTYYSGTYYSGTYTHYVRQARTCMRSWCSTRSMSARSDMCSECAKCLA
jgi:hypothetical protein